MDRKKEEIKALIITGLSGAGKTQAANCLEDLGYFASIICHRLSYLNSQS